jgi:oligoendopeptidase F
MAPTPLTLAETASVFGKMLAFKLLAGTTDTKQRKAMLAAQVEGYDQHGGAPDRFLCVRAQVHGERRSGD